MLAIATVAAAVFIRLRLSSAAAFLIAGAILGPTGLRMVSEQAVVDAISEVGVALFLFTIGLEVSLTSIGRIRRQVLWAGGAQVGVTVAVATAASLLFGLHLAQAIFTGFVLSLSSTAIVTQVYASRGESDTIQGRLSAGILVLQDLAAIPMMLLIPTLHQWDTASIGAVLWTLGKGCAGVGVLVLLARVAFPRLIREVVALNSREVLGFTILLVSLGTAWLAQRFGLTLAMGAFVAGVVISESDYVHEITAQIAPFRDVFWGVSYVGVGMLLNLPFLRENALLVLGLMVGISAVKALSAGAAIRFLGYSTRLSLVTAIGIVQIGEFSFMLLSDGHAQGLVSTGYYQLFLAVTILMMTATPPFMWLAPLAVDRAARLLPRLSAGRDAEEEAAGEREGRRGNHVIIAGYGVNGKNLVRVLKATRIPYVVVDLNQAKVEEGKRDGEPMLFGDLNSPGILERLNVDKARILVVAITDPLATRNVVRAARKGNPSLFIVVRTRYLAELDDLLALGANAVIPEEFETSVEIFSRVLAEYHVPDHVIRQQEQIVRAGTYRILRERTAPKSGEVLAEFEEFLRRKVIEVFYVVPGSPWEGRTVGELPAGGDTGIVLLAVLREDRAMAAPPRAERLLPGDRVVLFGGHAPLAEALSILSEPPPPSTESGEPPGDGAPEGTGG